MYKKKIYIVLGHAVKIPISTTGGIEKLYQEIIDCIELPNDIMLIMVGRGNCEKLIYISNNKYIQTIKGYDWSNSKLKNLLNSFLWMIKIKKIVKNSDLTIYNTPFGSIIDKFFKLSKIVAINDQRGTGKLKFLGYFSDRIYVISEIVKNSWPKIMQDKIYLVHNGVNLHKFKRKFRYKNIENENYNIVFVGRISKEKGVKELIEAVNILVNYKNIKKIKLNIIGPYKYSSGGDEKYYNKLIKLIEKYNLNSYITFLGERSTDEIVNIFSKSNILVTPSIWPEAFGIVNIEAMATGLPVIGFNIGAMPEIIEDEKSGFLIKNLDVNELAEKIYYHYKMPIKDKILMEEQAFKRAQKFDIKEIANKYKIDYLRLLNY